MAEFSDYSRITPELEALAAVCLSNNQINKEDYVRYNVKRGLRDLDGTGVLAGLTEISEIISSKVVDGKKVPCEGELYYRGYPVEKLTGGFIRDKRFGFEETAYLLMFGQLPAAEQLKVKADRALQRQREKRQHEKNLREGKKKPWAVPAPAKENAPPVKKSKPARGASPSGQRRDASRPARPGGPHKPGPGGRKLSGKFRHHP